MDHRADVRVKSLAFNPWIPDDKLRELMAPAAALLHRENTVAAAPGIDRRQYRRRMGESGGIGEGGRDGRGGGRNLAKMDVLQHRKDFIDPISSVCFLDPQISESQLQMPLIPSPAAFLTSPHLYAGMIDKTVMRYRPVR